MASRRDIKEAFQTHLTAAVTGMVDAGDVTLTDYDMQAALPRVVYTDLYRFTPINDASGSPEAIERDGLGNVTAYKYHEHEEAVFTITAKASNEQELEPIYEAIRTYFGKYQFQPWDESEINEDVWRVRVRDVRTSDDNSSENTTRGDTMEVHIAFIRTYTLPVDTIDVVDQTIEGNNYTTN